MVVKVGILGDKNKRDDSGEVTNAEIGLVHELGSKSRNIPARSFLQMPLHQRQQEIVAETKAGAESKIKKGDTLAVLKTLGVACENAVQDAFGTQGFDTWEPDKPETIARKGSAAPLIDSAQLRKSITSKVEKKV